MGQSKLVRVRDLHERIHLALDKGDYRGALRLAQREQQKRPDDDSVADLTATAYIDAGDGLKDLRLIDKGIRWFEARERSFVFPRTRVEAAVLYNLANGYAAKLSVRRAEIDLVALSEDPDVTRQKILYRRAAETSVHADPDLTARSLVNFGNLLRQLGRWVEAADQYDAALDLRSNHGPALAHSAKTLFQIGHLARHNLESHLLGVHDRLARALRSRRSLVRIAGPRLLEEGAKDMAALQRSLGAHGGLDQVEGRVRRREGAAETLRGANWKVGQFWAREGLFLSINARLRKHRIYWRDDVAPARAIEVDWPSGALREKLDLCLEEMMTDYAVARHLFTLAFQSDVPPMKRLVALAAPQRPIADLRASRVPLLKVAYRVAADILDKGAVYINALCGLGVPEKATYHGAVWHEKGNIDRPLSSMALRAIDHNSYVRGMYDLSLDWRNADLDDRLRQFRHALTHRYLPVYLQSPDEGRKAMGGLSAHEFETLTILALRTARAVILHSVGATEVETGHRIKSSRGVAGQRIRE